MLGSAVDIFRLRQYFDVVAGVRDVVDRVREDAHFLTVLRRAVVTLPGESSGPTERHPFPAPQHHAITALEGQRVALVSTGGSGALASLVGVMRALEELSVTPEVMSICSGAALFGFPLAAGHSADAVAEFTLGLRPSDYIDINWRDLGRLPLGGRGFAGIVRGERIEASYRELLGDARLEDLQIPCYVPIWNIEENRVEYLGPRTYPRLPVARAIRVAVAIPLFIDPVEIDGRSWCDGGIVDVFPVRPALAIDPPACDIAIAVNGFYPPEFAGEDVHGWRQRNASILEIASQVRYAQQIELARENLARLRESCEVLMTEPVDYSEVRGAGFYERFLDRSDWPDYMRAGRETTLRAIRGWAARHRGPRSGPGAAGRAARRRRGAQPAPQPT